MGLDQNAYYCEAARLPCKAQVDFDMDELEATSFQYWRKHPDLHGWMEALYIRKGGKETFNFTPVRLEVEDLDQLERSILSRNLPHTTGFFFGSSDGKSSEEDLEFIRKARIRLAEGYAVFYNSWW